METLGRLGVNDGEVRGALLPLLSADSLAARARPACTLASLGVDGNAVVDALLRLVVDDVYGSEVETALAQVGRGLRR